jgi:hypothetical protein
VTLSASVPYTWAGVLMVCKESILTAIFAFEQNHEHEVTIFPSNFILVWTFGMVCLVISMYHGEEKNWLCVGPLVKI